MLSNLQHRWCFSQTSSCLFSTQQLPQWLQKSKTGSYWYRTSNRINSDAQVNHQSNVWWRNNSLNWPWSRRKYAWLAVWMWQPTTSSLCPTSSSTSPHGVTSVLYLIDSTYTWWDAEGLRGEKERLRIAHVTCGHDLTLLHCPTELLKCIV